MGWEWSWKATALVALGLVAAGVAGPVACAGAATTAPVLAPGQVVTASPASTLTAPADGRIRGTGFDATVTKVGWPASVGVGGHAEVAGHGQRLVVFSLKVTEVVHTQTELTHVTLATATLDAGRDVLSVPLASLDTAMRERDFTSPTKSGTADATFAASVPDTTHDVDLVMTQAGYSQRFDLWTLKRVPPDPAVLYRPETGSYSVTASSKGAADIPLSDPAGLSAPADLSVRWATLSEFSAGMSTTPAPKATEAYLDVELLGTTSIDRWGRPVTDPYKFEFTTPLPGDRLTFTPVGGTPVQATLVPDREAKDGLTDDGLFDALYDFVVPASTTAGTLSVVPGPLTGEPCSYECEATTPSVDLGPASVPLTFPDPPGALPKQHTPPWIGAPNPPTGTAATNSAPRALGSEVKGVTIPPAAGGGFPVWLAVVLVLLAGGAAIGTERYFRRRRRHRSSANVGPAAPCTSTEVPHEVPGSPSRHAATVPGQDGGVAGAGIAPTTPCVTPAAVAMAPPIAPTTHSVPPLIAPTALEIAPPIAPTVLRGGAGRSVDAPPLGGDGDLVVRVLGPVEISGWVTPAERRTVTESQCCYLALHSGRPRSIEELLVALEPVPDDRSDGSEKTLRNNLSRLRQAVGAEHFPDAAVSGGYRLEGVVTDWQRFCDLEAEARGSEGQAADVLLAEALVHVRGVPFEGVPTLAYSWALTTGLAEQMTGAVVRAAHRLSEIRLTASDPTGALHAARAGQRSSATDFTLWHDLFAATRAQGDPGALARLRAEARRVIGEPLAAALFEGKTPFAA